MREVELGDKVKDMITGYEGIAVAKTVFINGCIQFSIAHQLKKGEKMPDLTGDPCIDSKSLRVVKKKAVDLYKEEKITPKSKRKRSSGGPTTIGKRMRGY